MNRIGPLLIVASLVTALIACGPSSGALGTLPPATPGSSVDPGPDLTPAPSGTATPAPSEATPPASGEPTDSPQVTPAPTPDGTTIVRAYFYFESIPGSSGLVPVLREVPATKAVAAAAMAALLAGPTETESGAMSSAVPAGTRVLGITIKDGVATVDLSSEFESGGGSASASIRLGQVVYTLTQFSSVKSVLFKIDGQTVTVFGSEGVVLDGPVARADYVDLLPNIFVDRPAYGAALGNPGRVTGSTDVFEATFRITLRDGGGRVIVDQQVMATCGSGCRGTFDVTLRYDVPKAQWGTLRVWAGSAKDGSPVSVREYPVWLTPAG
jgi:sporulation and spore germination protein/immunoglobulin-like protein involved in spore germination